MVAATAGCRYLGCSRLTADLKVFAVVTGLLAQTLADNQLQNLLYVSQRTGLAHILLNHLGREFTDNLTVLQLSLHESGLHHLASVGNSVVECQRSNWRQHGLIAYAHPG